MNKIHEMYPYLKLLNYKHIKNIPQTVQHHGNRNGYKRYTEKKIGTDQYVAMQNLLQVIAIRRTKSILDLPVKTYKDTYLDMSYEEREFYNVLTDYSRKRVKKLMLNMNRIRGSALLPAVQNRLRVIMLQCMLFLIFHLRIACCDPLLVIDKIPRVKNLNLEKATEILRCETNKADDLSNDCIICYNNEATVINKNCGHKACPDCWKRLSKMEPMICFTCLDVTAAIHLEDQTPERKDLLRTSHDERLLYRSSKTRTVLDLIKKELNKRNKVVVISQWTTYLDLIISQFKCENPDIRYIKLDGKTIPMKRQKTVEEFQNDKGIKVCFASLGSTAEGVTLHSACSMIICDVYWNKAKISQISDRIHRIGQKKNVIIYCLYVRNSIEMRLKDLIEKKDVVCRVIVDCQAISRYVDSWLTRMIKLID
jgi:SNF2 family DNA or RNA helicase